MNYAIGFLLLHPLLLLLYTLWAWTGWKVLAIIGYPIDILLNYTTAWVLWGKPAKGDYTISKRLKRSHTGLVAETLTKLLDKIKPGHIEDKPT